LTGHRPWAVARGQCPVAILIIPTTLMGATLPVISRAVASGAVEIAGRVGRFYALNTAGAVAGAWLTGFVLLPTFGVTPTIRIAVACNLAAAAAAWLLGRRWAVVSTAEPSPIRAVWTEKSAREARPRRVRAWVFLTLALSGAAALIDEVAWARALGLILGSSVYAFTAMLATFLIGSPAGDPGGGLRAGWFRASRSWARVQIGVAIAGLVTVIGLSHLPMALVRGADALALGARAIPLLQFGLSFLVMCLPTVGFGLVFPFALHVVMRESGHPHRDHSGHPHRDHLDDVGATVGRIYAVNTVGAIVGAGLAGFVLIPVIGVQGSLLLAIGVSLALGMGLVWADPSVSRRRAAGLTLGLTLAGSVAVTMIPSWSATLMSSGMYWNLPRYVALYRAAGARGLTDEFAAVRTVYQREGLTATVVVQREAGKGRSLTINGRTESGDAFMRTQVMIAHWPLWLARSGDRVLVIGMGSGATAGSVLQYPIGRLDVVELEAAILDASHYFEPENGRPLADPRTRAIAADGRNFLLLSDERYDVIISQPSLPWVAGAATLFTQDFLRHRRLAACARRRVRPWVTADAMRADQLRSVMAAFASCFRISSSWSPPAATCSSSARGGCWRWIPRASRGSGSSPRARATCGGCSSSGRRISRHGGRRRVDRGPLLAGVVPNTDENLYVEFSDPLRLPARSAGNGKTH
jgi:spermidine synthase